MKGGEIGTDIGRPPPKNSRSSIHIADDNSELHPLHSWAVNFTCLHPFLMIKHGESDLRFSDCNKICVI